MTHEEACKLDQIAATLGELSVAFKTHDAREEACRKTVQRLCVTVEGTPDTPGLDKRVDRIEQRSRLLWGVMGAGAAVVGFLAERAMAIFRG